MQPPEFDVELGFKGLAADNWLTPDSTLELFVRLSVVGPIQITAEQWAERFIAVELAAAVPIEVRRLFAVARGVLVYGGLFYPLYGLGEERLFVVADAAILHRYRRAGGTRRPNGAWPRYVDRLRWLNRAGALDGAELERWQSLRELRNLAAHSEEQTLMTPSDALRMLEVVARDINALFSEK